MKLILGLAFKNLKKYAREAVLVILSILLTVSMMTMVASTINSLYSSLMSRYIETGQNSVNATVYGVVDVKGFMDGIRDEVSSYYISDFNEKYQDNDNDLYVYANPYQACQLEDIEAWCLRNEIIEGRRTENRNEIVIHKDSKYHIGDKLTLDHFVNGKVVDKVEVTVVGRSKSPSRNDFFVSEEEMSRDDSQLTISLVFKEGSKNIDKKLNKIIDSTENSHIISLVLDDDYNFFMGMQNKPGPLLLATASTTMIMLLLVGLVTISLILNSFELFITKQEKSIGTFRSIGMTKDQLRVMILGQGFVLSSIGLILGILLGVLLGKVLISYISINIRNMFMTLGSENNIEVFFDTSAWMYIMTILSSFIIIYFAQRKKLKALFSKSSIETLREHRLAGKEVKVDLSKDPINGLAKINTKMTRDFKGIQTALMISVILLIGINGWINSFYGTFETLGQYYDSSVNMSRITGKNFNEDTIKVINLLNKYDEIEEIIQVSRISSIQLTENNLDGSIYDEDIVIKNKIRFDYMYISVLEDNFFKDFIKASKLNANTKTIFFNYENVQIDDEFVSGNLVDLSKTEEIELKDIDSDKVFKIKIDAAIEKINKIYAQLFYGPNLFINETYYKENMYFLRKGLSSIYIKSELSQDSLIKLSKELDSLELDNHFYFHSDYFGSHVPLIINKTVFTITSAIFLYIAFVILINVLNITLSTYQIRKQDIAILLSIGASKAQIEKMFLREAFLISFKPYIRGLIIGNVIAFGMVKLTSLLADEVFTYRLSPIVLFISLALVLVIILAQYFSVVKENKKLDLISDIRSY